jgi:hypothetical protein
MAEQRRRSGQVSHVQNDHVSKNGGSKLRHEGVERDEVATSGEGAERRDQLRQQV